MIIAVDFDGTCVDHIFPKVGRDVPGAASYLKKFIDLGARIILWTMRGNGQENGNVLDEAVQWFTERNIPLFGINCNPEQYHWTDSPKVYAHIYVDDAAFGCPLRDNSCCGGRPYVDWDVVGPRIIQQLEES